MWSITIVDGHRHIELCRQKTNIKHTKSQNVTVSHPALYLYSYNLLKPGVKSEMGDQQFYCLLRCGLY